MLGLAQVAPTSSFASGGGSLALHHRDVAFRQDITPHESPGLSRGGPLQRHAFELKFVLTAAQASEVESRLASQMAVDPHANSALGNSYKISTIYCDTRQWDVLYKRGRFKFVKLRLRRYNQSNEVHLERKARRKNRVRKLRSTITMSQIEGFVESVPMIPGCGGKYYRHLQRNQLRPVCVVQYDRTAYFASTMEGPIRLTFDRHVYGGLAKGWSFDIPHQTVPLLSDAVICEFKYRGSVPAMFKSVMEAMKLVPGRASKYRRCVEALGIAKDGGQPCLAG